MKEKIKNWLCRHTQVSLLLYAVVGGYLIYLAYQLFSEGASDALLIIAEVVFALCGLLLVLLGGYGIIFGYYKKPPAESSDNAE